MSSPNPRLKLSIAAQKDLVGILRYTSERWGLEQLASYRAKLNTALLLIERNPQIGHAGALSETQLLYPIGSHVIVYRVQKQVVEVIRILHNRMSIPRHC